MPFAPGVQDRSGEFMFAGISQAGAGFARGLEEALQGFQQKSNERKAYQGMLDALKEAGVVDEVRFEQLKNADTDTIRGTVDGLITARTLKNQDLQNALREQNMRSGEFLNRQRAAQTALLEDELSQGAARKRFYGELDSTIAAPLALSPEERERYVPKAPSQAQIFGALGRSGFAPKPSELDEVLALAGGPGSRFTEDPVSGYRFMQHGRQVLPSGVNPERGQFASSVFDRETGEPIPGVILAGGKVRNLPASTEARERKLSVDALVEAEKALRLIDEDITIFYRQVERAKIDKTRAAPDPGILKGLEARRARLEKLLAEADEAPAGESDSDKQETANTEALIAQAQEAIRRGADPEAVKKRLKQKFGITLK